MQIPEYGVRGLFEFQELLRLVSLALLNRQTTVDVLVPASPGRAIRGFKNRAVPAKPQIQPIIVDWNQCIEFRSQGQILNAGDV